MTEHQYRAAVLHHYTRLRDTPTHPRAPDRALASQLFAEGVPLAIVKAAFLIATARRTVRDPTAAPLPPIRSLAYFLPVIRELQHNPADPDYLDTVADQLRRSLSQPTDGASLSGDEIQR
jgi:hypothetical protein